MEYWIEIIKKDGFFLPLYLSVSKAINKFQVKFSKVYKINCNLDIKEVEKICKEVFLDPVTAKYTISLTPPHGAVDVWLKDAVTDPQVEVIMQCIKKLGFKLKNIKIIDRYRFYNMNKKTIKKLVYSIVNPVINDFKIW